MSRGRSPSRPRGFSTFPPPRSPSRQARTPSPTPTLSGPRQQFTAATSSSTSSAPSFGHQRASSPLQEVQPCPLDRPAYRERTPSPRNKQPRDSGSQPSSPTASLVSAATTGQPYSGGAQATSAVQQVPRKAPPAELSTTRTTVQPKPPPAGFGPGHTATPTSSTSHTDRGNTVAPYHKAPPPALEVEPDPWNAVTEIETPAVAAARAAPPTGAYSVNLGNNPRLVTPDALPSASTTYRGPWQDSFGSTPPTTPRTSPAQELLAPPMPMPMSAPPTMTPASVPRPLPQVVGQAPQTAVGTYHFGRDRPMGMFPIRSLVPCSLDNAPTPPNPMPTSAWGFSSSVLAWRAPTSQHQIPPLMAIPPGGVHQYPPGNFPYVAFTDDAPWHINTSLLWSLEFSLDHHLTASRLTDYGLVLDGPNPYTSDSRIERVLWMPLPNVTSNVQHAVCQAFVWCSVTGAITRAGHNNPDACYQVLMDFMSLAVHLREFPHNHRAVEPLVIYISDAILHCVCYTLPVAWRGHFATTWSGHITSTGTPPNFQWRRHT